MSRRGGRRGHSLREQEKGSEITAEVLRVPRCVKVNPLACAKDGTFMEKRHRGPGEMQGKKGEERKKRGETEDERRYQQIGLHRAKEASNKGAPSGHGGALSSGQKGWGERKRGGSLEMRVRSKKFAS